MVLRCERHRPTHRRRARNQHRRRTTKRRSARGQRHTHRSHLPYDGYGRENPIVRMTDVGTALSGPQRHHHPDAARSRGPEAPGAPKLRRRAWPSALRAYGFDFPDGWSRININRKETPAPSPVRILSGRGSLTSPPDVPQRQQQQQPLPGSLRQHQEPTAHPAGHFP